MGFEMTKFAAAVALGLALLATPAVANDAWTQSNPVPSPVVISSTPVVVHSGQAMPAGHYQPSRQYSAQSQSFFGRWMELERRKNAWIRQQLFGR